jgi:copper chaperone NosL
MLSTRARLLTGLAAVLLVGAWFLPLWRVALFAPQYPEGLGMHIWLSTVTGLKPNDLENINNLNHYIGMKRILPETIPELRLMPIALGVLIALGLAAAASARRWAVRTWVASFAVAALAGIGDFYRWEYKYGHDLDLENAIIKVPGMSYQPPLLGSKQLLNFTATSLPASGSIIAIVSLGLGVAALLVDRRRTTPTASAARAGRAVQLA